MGEDENAAKLQLYIGSAEYVRSLGQAIGGAAGVLASVYAALLTALVSFGGISIGASALPAALFLAVALVAAIGYQPFLTEAGTTADDDFFSLYGDLADRSRVPLRRAVVSLAVGIAFFPLPLLADRIAAEDPASPPGPVEGWGYSDEEAAVVFDAKVQEWATQTEVLSASWDVSIAVLATAIGGVLVVYLPKHTKKKRPRGGDIGQPV